MGQANLLGSGDVSGGGNKVEGGGPSVDGGVSGFGNDVQEEVCSGSESDSENDSVKGVHFDDSEEERDLGVDDAFEVELGGELGLCGEFGLGGGVVAGSIEENGGSVVFYAYTKAKKGVSAEGNGAAPQNGGNGPVPNQGNGDASENQGNGAATQSHVHAAVNLGADSQPPPVPSPVPVPIPVLAPASQPPPVVAPVVQPNPVLVASAKGKGASAAKGKGKMVVASQPSPASFPTKSNSKMVTSSQPAPTIHAERPKRVVQSRYMKPFAAAPVTTPAATPAVVSQNNAPTNGKGIAFSAPKGKAPLVSGPKGNAAISPKNPKVSEIPHGFTETARTRKLVKAWGDVTQSYNELKKRRLEDKK
ncbi:hypothetical protein RIF29_26310 [Crotalaria pallida]|uniref:Uncharacterized protein n=1 Tax=Crotalaria pallida TaxID=3830 RepID=A0AAN9EUV5_CROPI